MRINTLRLHNFRGFEEITLSLDRPLTVLLGVNGAGKTTILEAIVHIVSRVLEGFAYGDEANEWVRLRAEDVRVGAEHVLIVAEMTHEGRGATWSVGRPRDPHRWVIGPTLEGLAWRGTGLRLAVVYGASRSVALSSEAFAAPPSNDEHPYAQLLKDWLSAPRTGFRSFFQWFKGREDIENEQKVAREDLSHQDPQLAAIRRAVTALLPGFTGLRVQRDPLHLVVRKGGVLFHLDQLSEGERDLLVMVADLARRLAVVNPELADPLQGEAIVLIDEIELHLHPSWQRRVLHALQTTFPNCQFIVTTHSPQVISEVPNDAVVLVKDFLVYHPPAPTEGRDSNSILWEVLDVSPRPAEVTRELDGIRELLDEGRDEEARTRLDTLAEKLTERDPEVNRLRTMIDTVERIDASDHEGR